VSVFRAVFQGDDQKEKIMLAEFSLFPLDQTHLSGEVAKVVEALEEAGLEYRLGPMGTSIEGDWDELMGAIKACHQAVADHHARVITTITIDDHREGEHHLDEMITSVEESLGRPAKH
jgi:uncharacterized protein (TIGR00106 family)